MNGQVILPEVNRKAEKKTQEIDAEKRKDLVIALEVEQWVQMVDNISQGLQRFIDEDKMCLDLKSRYSLSRKAMKKTLAIEKLLSDAPSLNKMSCPSPAQGIGSSSIEGFKDFESRISMIKEVLEALRDDNINMIAICGDQIWANYWNRAGGYLFKNSLSLESHDLSDIVGSLMVRQLLQRSENLKLTKIRNLKNLKDVIDSSDQNLRAAFPSLERLELYELDNLEKIYDGQFPKRSFSGAQYACFGNLRYLTVFLCKRLKNVFSLSIARGLVQLHELKISDCDNLEEIFCKGGEDEKAIDMINFPKLTHISQSVLHRLKLQKLIGFCKPMDPVELVQPSHAKSIQPSSNLE
ncbi:disease resistance protein At4g27190-like, partial [Fagus crenata]